MFRIKMEKMKISKMLEIFSLSIVLMEKKNTHNYRFFNNYKYLVENIF